MNTINSNLPPTIKVFTFKSVTRKFDCKSSARTRIYEYLAPITMFMKNKLEFNLDKNIDQVERKN